MSDRRKKDRKYNSSVLGIARQLRSNHGYDLPSSLYLAKKCVSDYQRCEICGLSQAWNKTQKRFYQGEEKNNLRLQPDHINPSGPSSLENTRILCNSCNYLRGAAARKDEEVLATIKWWYEAHYSLKVLWWLNKSPGVGGTLFRNIYMERKAIKLLGLEGLLYLATLNIKIGTHTISPAPESVWSNLCQIVPSS